MGNLRVFFLGCWRWRHCCAALKFPGESPSSSWCWDCCDGDLASPDRKRQERGSTRHSFLSIRTRTPGRELARKRESRNGIPDPHHPYAADLDVFGVGSLFELINAAHTQIGRTTLAAWLLEPASPEEIVARQEAIKELSPKVDFRERLGFLAAEAQTWIPTESLISWARQPRSLNSNPVRVMAFWLPWLNLALLIAGQWPWCL